MSELPVISTIGAKDTEKTLATLTAAFVADPLFRWAYPSADNYLDAFPQLIRAYCGSGIGDGTAYSDAVFGGACIWLSPGHVTNDEAAGAVCEATIPPDRLDGFIEIMEEMDKYHPHDEPIWYLPTIGVDAAAQGKGIGSALMKHALQLCDKQGTRAYLESSNPANISLYERHGFEVIGRIEVGSAPPVHPMIREKH